MTIARWRMGNGQRRQHLMRLAALVAALMTGLAWAAAQSTTLAPPTRRATSDLGAKIVAAGQQMLADFPNSTYAHKTRIDRNQGVCEVDCSGFVATVLGQVAPQHVEVLPLKKAGRKRPLAEDFYAAFVLAEQGKLPGWQAVTQVGEARPGDVLAWYKEEHMKGENTGHVMLIAEPPIADGPGKWRIRVLDSTGTPHAQDTRPVGKTGLGSGTLWLDVDSSGRILGYHWKSKDGKLSEHPVAIGRAVEGK